jgi:hypothetical protein
MQHVTHELRQILNEYKTRFLAIPDAEFSAKPLAHKWSKKEVVGHLIDSAQNNLRRFICGQYENPPSRIVYDQDFWVSSNNYNQMTREDVIQLWVLMNERIAAVLDNMPKKNYGKQSITSEPHTLEWLSIDYVKHMKHHINQVIAGSFDVVYK